MPLYPPVTTWTVSDNATSGTVGRLAFTNLNGVTLSLSSGAGGLHTIVGSHNGLTTAALSNHSHGNPTLALTNLSGTTASNSAGLTLSLSAAAPGAGGAINVSAGTTDGVLSAISFSNVSGVTFGLSGSTITAAVFTDYLTTARRSTDAIGLATAQTNVTWTVNSNGLSLNAAGYAGTGLTTATTAGVAIVGTNNTSGLSLGVPAYITTARASNDAIGLNTAQSNVTWTVNSSGLSLDARGYAGTGTSATNASITLNSNGLAISVAAPGGGAGATASEFEPIYGSALLTNSTLGQNTLYFVPFDVPENVSAYRVNFFASINTLASNSNNTRSGGLTMSAALYSRGTGASTERIATFWSGSWFISFTGSSNSQLRVGHPAGIANSTSVSSSSVALSNVNATTYMASSVGGYRVIPMPISSTLTPGRYWMAIANSSVSANTQGLVNMSLLQQTNGNNIAYRPFGTSSAASNASIYPTWPGDGTYSATSGAFPATIGLSSDAIRAAIVLTLPYFNFSGYTTATNVL